jgi:hypothetical protein
MKKTLLSIFASFALIQSVFAHGLAMQPATMVILWISLLMLIVITYQISYILIYIIYRKVKHKTINTKLICKKTKVILILLLSIWIWLWINNYYVL